jgi:hypothetical protein
VILHPENQALKRNASMSSSPSSLKNFVNTGLMYTFILMAMAPVMIVGSSSAHAQEAPSSRAQVGETPVFYPRMIRLEHQTIPANNGKVVAALVSLAGDRREAAIFTGPEPMQLAQKSTINLPIFRDGICCNTLFELPQRVGLLPKGTILWSASTGGDNPDFAMQLPVFGSIDAGASWKLLSNCRVAKRARAGGAIWEPQFAVTAKGTLACYFSDEGIKGKSQILRMSESSDGLKWSEPRDIVVANNKTDRPGMAVVSKTSDNTYFMSFEVCGPKYRCAVFAKISDDGINWGDAAAYGEPVQDKEGRQFLHTPTNYSFQGADGKIKIALTGQVAATNGRLDKGNGALMMIDDSGTGKGPWRSVVAPIAIKMPNNLEANTCQNYSTPLLADKDGKTFSAIATDFVGPKAVCTAFVSQIEIGTAE